MSNAHITRVFFDADLRCSFDGLIHMAKAAKTSITQDSYIVFLNRRKTSFKLLAAGKYLIYYRSTSRVPLEAIRDIPLCFNGQSFDFSVAIEKSLRNKLRLKKMEF